jgi:CubicO group peptidase (beta-lactamase class C family)
MSLVRLALLLAFVSACAASAKRVAHPVVDTHATLQLHVEQHLLTTVQVQGEPKHTTLAAHMAELPVPGLSIAVFDDYELVWAATYGVTDADTGAPVRDTTLFQAGSISKAVNALAVMKVAADGKPDLDAPINDALRSWKLPDNELTRASPVALRRLLGHNAGTTVHGFPGYSSHVAIPTLVQVLDGAPPANTSPIRVDVAPGSIVRYSGGVTTITQLALVDTLGQAYPAILEQLVLAPLGMTHSTYEQPLPARRLAHAGAGHHRDGSVVPGKRHVYPEMAAAGLWTTPTDLARFFAEIARARANRSKRISRAIADAMTTPVDTDSGIGPGLFMSQRNGVAMFGHGGGDEGFQADAIASLDHGYGVVVMANSDNGFRLFPAVERTVFAAMGWPAAEPPIVRVAIDAAQRDRFLGSFRREDGLPLAISRSADGLALARPFFEPVELVPVSGDCLVRTDNGARYTFTTRDASIRG